MLDARNAMIAADQMRFGGANKEEMWAAFARRGMGADATVADADDDQPTPSFATPSGTELDHHLRHDRQGEDLRRRLRGPGHPCRRHRPDHRAGRHREVHPRHLRHGRRVARPGLHALDDDGPRGRPGPHRDPRRRGQPRVGRRGRPVIGSTAGSLNPEALIDGTEATNWAGVTEAQVDESRPVRRGRPRRRRQHGEAGAGERLPHARRRPRRPTSRSRRTTRTPARASPRCASSPSRPASAGCCVARRHVDDLLHLARRRVPERPPPPGRTDPQPARVRRARHPGRRRTARDAGEPVHRPGGLRRRAGQRPARRSDRLQDRLRPRHDRARRRAPGVR